MQAVERQAHQERLLAQEVEQKSEALSAAGLKQESEVDRNEMGGQAIANQNIELPSDSDVDDDESDEKDEEPPEDKIFAEFTKVNRTRTKFKCDFKNAILHINGHDYVIKNLQGDIDY